MNGTTVNTHEQYIHGVRRLVIDRAVAEGRMDATQADYMRNVKLVYGLGLMGGYRGVTTFGTWSNGHGPTETVEIAAVGEESWLQLACTTVHELAHVMAGVGVGHAESWKDTCNRLGLRRAKAAGMRYTLAALDPVLRESVYHLAASLADGTPAFLSTGGPGRGASLRPCSAGIGTRGGTSRGAGSGSRLLRASCATCGYVVRVTRSWIDNAGTPRCGIAEHGRMIEG